MVVWDASGRGPYPREMRPLAGAEAHAASGCNSVGRAMLYAGTFAISVGTFNPAKGCSGRWEGVSRSRPNFDAGFA